MNTGLVKIKKGLLVLSLFCVWQLGSPAALSETQQKAINSSKVNASEVNASKNSYSPKNKYKRKLRHNPFVIPSDISHIDGNSSSNVTENNLEIRAVLLGGKNPLVNVNGTILTLGQDINGYELKSVDEHRVVFINRGNEIVLELSKKDAVNDNKISQ